MDVFTQVTHELNIERGGRGRKGREHSEVCCVMLLDFYVNFDFFVESSGDRSELLENRRGIIFWTPLGYFWGI